MSRGLAKTGAVVSATLIVNVFTVFPPLALVAVQVTVVAPNGNMLPGAGLQTIVGAGLSPDETLKLIEAPAREVASALSPSGTIKAGSAIGGAYRTVTLNVMPPRLPLLDWAVQLTGGGSQPGRSTRDSGRR